jgi:carbon starvation protein CstA
MEENRDAVLTREIGRSMRFFLNLACLLIIITVVFLLYASRPLTTEGLMITLIPVIIAVVFFVGFLRLLKNIESNATENRDIELTTRVIWEFNKSWLIRAIMGKIQAFKLEKKPK